MLLFHTQWFCLLFYSGESSINMGPTYWFCLIRSGSVCYLFRDEAYARIGGGGAKRYDMYRKWPQVRGAS